MQDIFYIGEKVHLIVKNNRLLDDSWMYIDILHTDMHIHMNNS